MISGKAQGSAKDRAAARKLVKSVVLAQGNIFIRELLRQKKLPIGVRKEDFEVNLLKAINDGDLSLADVTDWLEEVEGWGDQHVYLYHVPDLVAAAPLWKSADSVRNKLPPAQRTLWNASSLAFPEEWELTRISYDNHINGLKRSYADPAKIDERRSTTIGISSVLSSSAPIARFCVSFCIWRSVLRPYSCSYRSKVIVMTPHARWSAKQQSL